MMMTTHENAERIRLRTEAEDAAVSAYTGEMTDAVEDAIRRRAGILYEIRRDALRWPNLLANTDDELVEWLRGQLSAAGFAAAAVDVSRRTMVQYAYWVADHYLSMTGFGIAAELKGNPQQDYWRAVAIIRNHCPEIRQVIGGI